MVNVLISTTQSQGDRPDDFCWVPEGELVGRYGMVCDSERPGMPGCGCGRAFGGFTSHRSTTSAMVVASDLTEAQWRARLHQTLLDTGWAEAMPADDLAGFIDELASFDLGAAAKLRPGSIVGRLAVLGSDDSLSDRLLLRGVGPPIPAT